jgi:hypothetical protein
MQFLTRKFSPKASNSAIGTTKFISRAFSNTQQKAEKLKLQQKYTLMKHLGKYRTKKAIKSHE